MAFAVLTFSLRDLSFLVDGRSESANSDGAREEFLQSLCRVFFWNGKGVDGSSTAEPRGSDHDSGLLLRGYVVSTDGGNVFELPGCSCTLSCLWRLSHDFLAYCTVATCEASKREGEKAQIHFRHCIPLTHRTRHVDEGRISVHMPSSGNY